MTRWPCTSEAENLLRTLLQQRYSAAQLSKLAGRLGIALPGGRRSKRDRVGDLIDNATTAQLVELARDAIGEDQARPALSMEFNTVASRLRELCSSNVDTSVEQDSPASTPVVELQDSRSGIELPRVENVGIVGQGVNPECTEVIGGNQAEEPRPLNDNSPVLTGEETTLSVEKMKTRKSFKEHVEQHPVPFVASCVMAAFVAGAGAAEWRRTPDIEELSRYRALGASPEQLKGKLSPTEDPALIKKVDNSLLPNNNNTNALSADAARKRDEIRLRHSVRKLRELEHGLPIGEVPNGVYGFAFPNEVEFLLRERDDGNASWMQYKHAALAPNQEYSSRIEIHKLQDGTLSVVGFLSEADLQLLESPNADGRVILYQKPWEEARAVASVPLARIRTMRNRPFRDWTLYELKIGTSLKQQAKVQP